MHLHPYSSIAEQFAAYRQVIDVHEFGNGNINDTYLVVRVQDIVNSLRHEFYLVEGSGHRELDQATERCVNSGFSRATVSEMS